MKKIVLTLFAAMAACALSAQPMGPGPGMGFGMMGGPMMMGASSSSVDVSGITSKQVTAFKEAFGLNDKQVKKIEKIAQKENESLTNVVISAKSNSRSSSMGMGGPMGGPMDGPGFGQEAGTENRTRGIDMSAESTQKELDKIYSASEKKILGVLSDPQKAQWNAQAKQNISERAERLDKIIALVLGVNDEDGEGGPEGGPMGGGPMGGPMGGGPMGGGPMGGPF